MKRHSPKPQGGDGGKSKYEGWTCGQSALEKNCQQLAAQHDHHSRESYDEFSFAAHALIPCRLV